MEQENVKLPPSLLSKSKGELQEQHLETTAKMIDLAIMLQNEIASNPKIEKFEERRDKYIQKYCMLYQHAPLLFDTALRGEVFVGHNKKMVEVFGKYRHNKQKLFHAFDVLQMRRDAESFREGIENIKQSRDIPDEEKITLCQEALQRAENIEIRANAIEKYIDTPEKVPLATEQAWATLALKKVEKEIEFASTDPKISETDKPNVLALLSKRRENITDDIAEMEAKLNS